MTRLKMQELHPDIVVKGHVENCNKSNYELFMVEMVNNSSYFRQLGNGVYKYNESQSKGEDDCYSSEYSLDFKLFGTTSAYKGKSTLSFQTVQYAPGVIAKCPPKELNGMKVVRLHVVLKNLSFEDMVDIENSLYDFDRIFDRSIKNDIQIYLKVITKKKNILMLFEYQFFYENRPADVFAVDEISTALKTIFESSVRYRKTKIKNKDFYVAVVYYEFFLIYKLDDKIELVDKVQTNSCPTYTFLKNINER